MFDQVFDSLRKVTEASVQLQQDMVQRWASLWPGTPATACLWGAAFPLQQLQRRWADTVSDLLHRQRETLEKAYRSGQESIEKAFKLGEVRTPEDLRVKTIELWEKCLESLRQTNEVQLREFHAATEKWLNLLARPAG